MEAGGRNEAGAVNDAQATVETTTNETTAKLAATPESAARRARFQDWLRQLSAEPYRFDFYQVLRHIEAANPHLPRLGEAQRPSDEPVRVAQPPEMTFAPAPLYAVSQEAGGRTRIEQRLFGMLGPNGPLPTHLTELLRERSRHLGDHTLLRFVEIFSHRFTLLFYRAWAQAQPALSLDRPDDQGFMRRLGALSGIGLSSMMGRDAVADSSKLHFTGRLARHVRDADGLLNWCRSEFETTVLIQQWRGHWMPLELDERTRLSRPRDLDAAQRLGRGAVLGSSVWDVQHKFRIVIGPLSEARYHAFLPGGSDLARLQAMVRQWVGLEFDWDLQLILRRSDVPELKLGRAGELGRSTWLGHYRKPKDADDLVIDVERTLTRARARRHANQASSIH